MPDPAKVEEVDRELVTQFIDGYFREGWTREQFAERAAKFRTTAEAKGAADERERIVTRLREREIQANKNIATAMTSLAERSWQIRWLQLKELTDELERGE